MTFTVINTQTNSQTYYLDTLSFKAKGESGEPEYISKDNLAKWIQFPAESVLVPANSKADVPFKIMIPSDITSGSYQSAITISSAPSEVVATNGAIVEAKTAILLFLNVKGESNKKVVLLDFLGNTDGIQTDLQQSYTFRIQNQGNVYSVPEGSIEIKDVFGRVLSKKQINESKYRILPQSTRTFDVKNEKIHGFMNVLKISRNYFLQDG